MKMSADDRRRRRQLLFRIRENIAEKHKDDFEIICEGMDKFVVKFLACDYGECYLNDMSITQIIIMVLDTKDYFESEKEAEKIIGYFIDQQTVARFNKIVDSYYRQRYKNKKQKKISFYKVCY